MLQSFDHLHFYYSIEHILALSSSHFIKYFIIAVLKVDETR